MINTILPTSVTIGKIEYKIRSDYRDILEIISVLNDPDYDERLKTIMVLTAFYAEPELIPAHKLQEAMNVMFAFISQNDNTQNTPAGTVEWEQDFKYIIAPINRILGCEARSLDYMHWWTFLSAYLEIGDCFFAQIVNIRNKRARNKKLDKAEQEFYKRNREIIDIKPRYNEAEEQMLKSLLGK